MGEWDYRTRIIPVLSSMKPGLSNTSSPAKPTVLLERNMAAAEGSIVSCL
jgi:hypothetical protein